MRSRTNDPVEYVFVYGMLLAPERANAPAVPATLDGYTLAFTSGLATVRPAEGAVVHGAVLEVSRHQLLGDFDRLEGVNPVDPSSRQGHYRRVPVTVTVAAGEMEVWVYIRNDDGYGQDPPSGGYLAMIHRGYLAFDHPVEMLERAVVAARSEAEERWAREDAEDDEVD